MTEFECLANEMNVKITTDKNGLYTKKCRALANICTDIILSDDERIFNLSWEEKKKIIKENFYTIFPYIKKGIVK